MSGSGLFHQPDSPADQSVPAKGEDSAAFQRTPTPVLSAGQQAQLLELARSSMEAAVRRQPLATPDPGQMEAPLLKPRACFVTLDKQTGLRGCIGHLAAHSPLYAAVMEAARQAALADPRFAQVRPDELAEIRLEISVLTDLVPVRFESASDLLAQVEPGRHGVVLEIEGRKATFLPQVWDQIPDRADFLDRLALKGGWESSAWRDARARISVYEVEAFHEPP